ncbi:hypothetical protein LCGC14_1076220 [marine sediment metagenome]|uniref:Uncharacterized protein n=1 Tax=marine sediment metagenome TaxID=412755 RepID=A0A0F9QMF5_9ZZZZ
MRPLHPKRIAKLVHAKHSEQEDYAQRCERKVWTYILLYNLDTIIFEGRMRQLVGKSIGAGVWEIRKKTE